MDFEFDNEMDAILRRSHAVDGATFDSHPDADEIAAFTERALSDASRARLTAHFADCGRCRTILSTTFINETETTVAAAAVTRETAPLPWYRKLFIFPQLTYTLGALAILFSGLFGYVLLRNIGDESQLAMAPKDKQPASTFGGVSNSNVSRPANSAAPADYAPAANAPAANAPASTVTMPGDDARNSVAERRENRGPSSNTIAASPSVDQPEFERDADLKVVQTRKQDDSNAVGNNTGGEAREDVVVTEPNKSAPPSPSPMLGGVPKAEPKVNDDMTVRGATEESQTSPALKKKSDDTVKIVGGRKFTRRNGVWYDSLYSTQPVTNVRRGTDEYKALDAGIRAAADKLGGTVVVVSGTRAYRIN